MISITLIKDQIERVLRHSQPGLENAPLDLESLVQRWYAAKQIFLDAWGDAIYELPEPVVFELSEEDKQTRLRSFTSYIIDTYDNEELADFIDEHPDSFFDNHLKNDVAWPGIAPIAKGTKFIKAFKYFESDQRILDDLLARGWIEKNPDNRYQLTGKSSL